MALGFLISFLSVLSVGVIIFALLWLKVRFELSASTQKFNAQLVTLDKRILHAKEQLETTFDSILDGIVVIDKDYNITRLNKTYAKFTKKSIENILLRKCYKSFRNLDEPCPECPINNVKYIDGYGVKIGKNNFQVEVKTTTKQGEIQNHIETIRDVTRFENLHTQLRRSERLATIGTLVAGIAHEINNPLSGISGNPQLMLRTPEKYGLNQKGYSRMETIFESVKRATEIMKDLLNFAHPNKVRYKQLNLSDLVYSTSQKIQNSIELHNDIKWEFPNKSYNIWGDKSQIENVLANIIMNSIQAIQEKLQNDIELDGLITFKAENIDNNIILSIIDNGVGIPENNIGNVFDPFFTTKDPGIGVGLGLNI